MNDYKGPAYLRTLTRTQIFIDLNEPLLCRLNEAQPPRHLLHLPLFVWPALVG